MGPPHVPWKTSLILFSVLVVLVLPDGGRAGITHYSDTDVSGTYHLRFGLITPDDFLFGGDDAYVRINVVVTQQSDPNDKGHVDLLLFHSDEGDKVGYVDEDNQKHWCCTTELSQDGKCDRVGDLILADEVLAKNSSAFFWWSLQFNKTKTSYLSREDKRTDITKSGIYYFWVVNCEESETGPVTMDGYVLWKNPFGHLSIEQWPNYYFYLSLSLCFLVIGIAWFVLSALHWRKLLVIQNWIAAVIALGMVEAATLYFTYLVYNQTGEKYVAVELIGVLVSTLKRTLSRVLVLVVSMGYGVVRPTLGPVKHKVWCLGVFYFSFSGMLSSMEALEWSTTDDVVPILLVFPVALLDTMFYWWICYSLFRTISQLSARNQTLKLRMYKSLLVTLLVAAALSALMTVINMAVIFFSPDRDSMWRITWLWNAYWHIQYMGILLAIAFVWRPTENNTRYACTESVDDASGEHIALQPLQVMGLGDIIKRKKEDDKWRETAASSDIPVSVSMGLLDDEEMEPSKLE